jgi:hypothetical protein
MDSGVHAHHLRQIAESATDQLSSDRFEKPPRRSSTTPRQVTTATAGRSELELDQEATAALLMLNSDRRQWRGVGVAKAAGDDSNSRRSSGGGGMSVRDLLSG